MIKNKITLLLLSISFCLSALGGNLENAPQVMGWVPAYGMQTSMEAIESNPLIGKGLTRIGLQFWNPSSNGRGLVFAPVNKDGVLVIDADLIRFRDWARMRNIKVFLTIYNNSQVMGKWDWELAKLAFDTNREIFVKSLIDELKKYDLDGIDLDLEGEGNLDEDRVAYALFVKELSRELKLLGKLLTVDSFHSPCANAPNMLWWGDWIGQVDAIHSMGYQDLYEGSTETFTPPGKSVCEGGQNIFKYSWQLQYGLNAGYRPDQILMGMPSWLDSWGKGGLGSSVLSHIKEAQVLGVGVALWDLQLAGVKWRGNETWGAIRNLRKKPGSNWKALH